MTLVIGVDEAGYGPNLGPLCIGLSAWEVEQAQTDVDLYQLLESVVVDKPDGARLAVADSKALYKPGGGLATLERGVLAMLGWCYDRSAKCFDTLLAMLEADVDDQRRQLPWHQNGFEPAVPVDRDQDSSDLAPKFDGIANARLRSLRGRLVFPNEFNAGCGEYDSKGLALSHWTLGLLRGCIDECIRSAITSGKFISPVADASGSPGAIQVTCDKHGGRNNYAGLLTEHFPEYTLRVIIESRPRSAYLLASDDAEIRIEFRTKGESRLEAALASMVAKYLRELSMHAFNAFWQSHLPDLKPTAGYPMDARRFKTEIEAKQRELGIEDAVLWRDR